MDGGEISGRWWNVWCWWEARCCAAQDMSQPSDFSVTVAELASLGKLSLLASPWIGAGELTTLEARKLNKCEEREYMMLFRPRRKQMPAMATGEKQTGRKDVPETLDQTWPSWGLTDSSPRGERHLHELHVDDYNEFMRKNEELKHSGCECGYLQISCRFSFLFSAGRPRVFKV